MSYSLALSVLKSKNTWAVYRLYHWYIEAKFSTTQKKTNKEKYEKKNRSLLERFFGLIFSGGSLGFLAFFWPTSCYVYWYGFYNTWVGQNDQLKNGPIQDRIINMFTDPSTQEWSKVEIACMSLALFGSGLRLWAQHTLGKHFTFEMTILDDHQLITHGPYSVVRHPGYTASCSLYMADAIIPALNHRWPVLAAVNLALMSLALFRIPKEDAVLLNHFGDECEKWQQRTWAIIPFIW